MDEFHVYAIYEKANPHPDDFTIWRHRVVNQGRQLLQEPGPWAVAGSLEGARALLPAGLLHVPRDPHDAEGLIECWREPLPDWATGNN